MSSAQLNEFLELALTNSDLIHALNNAGSLDEAAAIAQRNGFDVSWKDWIRYQAQNAMTLNESEMHSYLKKLSKGIEILPHATYIPVLGLLCKEGAFAWVRPFVLST